MNLGICITYPYSMKDIPIGINTIQLMFTKKLTEKDILYLQHELSINEKIKNIYIHSSYKVNIAAPIIDHYSYSLELLKNEIDYMRKLNIKNIILHTGKNNVLTENEALHNIKKCLKIILTTYKDIDFILETSSGQQSEQLYILEHFVKFAQSFKKYDNFYVCIDTCHIYQAGYDINKKSVITYVRKLFKGLKIKLIHLNNSYYPLGLFKDRHEKLHKGYIQPDKLKYFIKKFNNIDIIIETSEPYEEQLFFIL